MTSLGVSGRGPAVIFSYDAATGKYTISSSSASASFDASGGSRAGQFDKYTLTSGTTTDELRLFRNVASSTYTGLRLSYLSYGIWSHSDSQTGERELVYFLFGTPTATSDMPRTGSASYNTAVSGNIRDIKPTTDGVTEYAVGGSATFTADFAAGTVGTELTLVRSDNLALGTYSGTGTISANQFTGIFSSTNPYFQSGSFMGGFFGPAASEMGYTFFIRNYNPDPHAGASVNYVDQSIIGVVVGTKATN
ncbi:MAG: transferrin-binding protein-like solute binding protein [Alphaproteobacteria bacterium]